VTAKPPRVPPTPAPAPEIAINPTKTTRVAPRAIGCNRASDGNGGQLTIVNLVVTPFETVEVILDDNARAALVQMLTGGVVIPS